MKFYSIVLTAIVFTVGITCFSARGQEYAQVRSVKELTDNPKLLHREHPNLFEKTQITGVNKIDDKHYVVAFLKNKIYHEAVVTPELMLVETNKLIKVKDVPDVVMAAIKDSDYASWKIEEAFVSTTPYTSRQYRIDVYSEKKEEEKRLYFDTFGNAVKKPF